MSTLTSLLYLLTTICISNAYLDQAEIIALNNLFDAWNGQHWINCKWNITAINDSNPYNVIPNHCGLKFGTYVNQTNYQYIRQLSFYDYPHNNMTGTIPTSISSLKNLLQIVMFYNDLYGTIPSAICNITSLIDLNIYGNNFNGPVPDCLFDMPYLLSIALVDNPKLLIKSSNLEQICNNTNSQSFEWLQLANILYIGEIPECIGYNLTNLYFLQFAQISGNLSGSIPMSLNNLVNLVKLKFSYLHGLDSIHKTHLNLKEMRNLIDINLDLLYVDIDLMDLCELHLFGIALTNYDESNLVKIPNNCVFENNSLETFEIRGNGFVGSIDETLCKHNETLVILALWDTKYLEINIPNCIIHFHELIMVTLQNNRQFYSIPEYSFNSSNLYILCIYNNPYLSGKINNLLTENSFKYLQAFALHNNNFYDPNINDLLHHLFYYSKSLSVLTLHGNHYLSGKLPEPEQELRLDYLVILTLHNLDIYGIISPNIYLSKNVSLSSNSSYTDQILITLYNTRLSGTITPHLFENINQKYTNFNPLVLYGNKFTLTNKQDIAWLNLNSLFVSVSQLYIQMSDIILSYFTVVCMFIFAIIYMVQVIRNKNDYNINDIEQYIFLHKLQNINDLLFDKFVVIAVIILTIFYVSNSKYYQSDTFLSMFCAYNFYSNNIAINIMIYILVLLFNIGLILKLIQINHLKHTDLFKYNSMNSENSSIKLKTLYDSVEENQDTSYLNTKKHSLIHDWIPQYSPNQTKAKVLLYVKTIVYFIMFVSVIFLLFIYFLFQTLPENNTFGIKSYTILQTITTPISLLLAITKTFVVPRFVNNLFGTFKISPTYRNDVIMFLRSIIIVIAPFIISFIFISQCGNLWTIYWNNCAQNEKGMFDIDGNIWTKAFRFEAKENDISNRLIIAIPMQFENLLRSDDICGLSNNINISKCIRKFYDVWIPVLIRSILYTIFTPILIIIYKTIKNKIFSQRLNENHLYLSVDSEYIMISTKLEMCLIFSVMCPLMIPLVVCLLKWNEIIYYFMIVKLNWKLTFSPYKIQLKFLYFGLILQNVFSFLFLFY
eukprot:28269_1